MSAHAEATIDRSTSVQIVDPRQLQPGDIIIISSGSHFESWLIRTATAYDATHVAVHIGSGVGIEANDPGVEILRANSGSEPPRGPLPATF